MGMEVRQEKMDKECSTLVAAVADRPHFNKGINFEEWSETAKFNLHLLLKFQEIPLILRASPLPSPTRLTSINAATP